MHSALGLLGCRRGTDSAQRGRPKLGLRSQVAPLLGTAHYGPQGHVAPSFLGIKFQAGAAQGCGAGAAELPCSSQFFFLKAHINEQNQIFLRSDGMCTLTFCFPFHLLSNLETRTNCS